jgi:hypothetical protein
VPGADIFTPWWKEFRLERSTGTASMGKRKDPILPRDINRKAFTVRRKW